MKVYQEIDDSAANELDVMGRWKNGDSKETWPARGYTINHIGSI